MPFQTSTQTRFRSQPVRSKPSCILGVVRTVPSKSYDQPWNGQTSRARQTPRSSVTTRRAPVAADVVERVHRALARRGRRSRCRRRGRSGRTGRVPRSPTRGRRTASRAARTARARARSTRDRRTRARSRPSCGSSETAIWMAIWGRTSVGRAGCCGSYWRRCPLVTFCGAGRISKYTPPLPSRHSEQGRSGRPVSVVFWGHRRDGTPPAERSGRKGLSADGVRD